MKGEAIQFAQKQLAEKWSERGASWYSSEPSIFVTHGTLYIEARKVEPQVTPHELSEADKLNGVQWSGEVQYVFGTFREYDGGRAKEWTEWQPSGFRDFGDFPNGKSPRFTIVNKKGE
jgi:hypothetical protein